MTNILLLGQGAREHVVAETFKKNPEVSLFSFMKTNNPGIAKLSTKVQLGDILDVREVAKFAVENKVEFAFIGPEGPLEVGIVDELERQNIPSIGPHELLAQLETSKSFTRNLLEKYKIPGNSRFKVFQTPVGMKEFMQDLKGEFVVKADGLMGGKGVHVAGDHFKTIEEGFKIAEDCILRDTKVVIEEKFVGEEFSLQCFCDGTTVKACPVAQDHKRAYVNDKGPNTGGMGSYSDADHSLPFLKEQDVGRAIEITQKVANALTQETGIEYKGILYGGFIATKYGVKLIEYNARFGDPEAMNVLPLLTTDLTQVCKAIIDGTLDKLRIQFENKATVCKYIVPQGYPGNPVSDERLELGNTPKHVKVYYAAVDEKEDGLYMTTSRALGVVGIADTISEAEELAQFAMLQVKGKVFYREDIGTKELIDKRIKHMEKLRNS